MDTTGFAHIKKIKNSLLTRDELESQLAESISNSLREDIESRGQASLLVSGGSTPKGLFAKLSNTDLDWNKVVICPVDERFVENGNPDQNGTLIREHLLQNNASSAKFIPMIFNADDEGENLTKVRHAMEEVVAPFSVVILGMGTDGHTASLFPDAPELDEGMNKESGLQLMTTHPVAAPYSRITFTRPALLNCNRLILHIYGSDKRDILDQAKTTGDWRQWPIAGFADEPERKLEVYWTE